MIIYEVQWINIARSCIIHVLNVSTPISPKFNYDSNNNIFNLVNFSNDLVFPSKAGDIVSPCKLFTIAVHNSTCLQAHDLECSMHDGQTDRTGCTVPPSASVGSCL